MVETIEDNGCECRIGESVTGVKKSSSVKKAEEIGIVPEVNEIGIVVSQGAAPLETIEVVIDVARECGECGEYKKPYRERPEDGWELPCWVQ